MVLLTPRWLVRHVLLAAALSLCFIAGRWQFHRAVARDSVLNWSYTVEWGLFGAFALLCWGWLLRDELRGGLIEQDAPPPTVYLPAAQPVSDDEDPELAAYNRYLAELNQKGRR